MEEKNLKNIKKTIGELVEKMGFKPKIEIEKEKDKDQENIICNIIVEEDSHLLIGQYGINLQALQHIARLLIRKEVEEKIKFILDVNSYRQQKNQSVIEQAKVAAEQAINEGRAIVLRPMSAYERRIIHIELANNPEVVTESIGEGEGRKVVVKPAKKI
jgi:spoIIIJ-associated protein